MSALIYLEPKIGRGRYLFQILDPHIRHNTKYSTPNTQYPIPWRKIFDFFITTDRKSSKHMFFVFSICLPPGRRLLLTPGIGMGGGNRDQYLFHPSPHIK